MPFDRDNERKFAPTCTATDTLGLEGCEEGDGPDGDIRSETARVIFGCPLYTVNAPPADPLSRNLCTLGDLETTEDGFLGAYLNAWIYKDKNGGFLLWQQNHIDASTEGDHCGNAQLGEATAVVFRAAANSRALDEAFPELIAGTSTPLQGVKISDGSKSVYTNSSGQYSIQEPAGNSFALSASKLGLVTAYGSGTALPGTTVDFQVFYEITGVFDRYFVSTALAPTTSTLTISSYAPGADSGSLCVVGTDAYNGSEILPSYVSTLGGLTTWAYPRDFDQGSGEGKGKLTFVAKECASGVPLTPTRQATLTLDNTAPNLDPRTIFPGDNGHTIFSQQRVGAKVVDNTGTGGAPSGIDSSSIGVAVADSDGQTITFAGSQLTYKPSSGWSQLLNYLSEPDPFIE